MVYQENPTGKLYAVEGIVEDVRIAIDENRTGAQLITDEDIDTLSLDEIIRSKIAEAARRVISEAPVNLIDSGLVMSGTVTRRKASQSGWILLNDDFMRLIIFKMSDWERPVYEAISAQDPRYAMQFSRYAGIRGTAQQPVVAITRRAEGLALEFFPFTTDAGIEQALYFPYPKIDTDGGINIPEHCYRAVIYQAAALTLSAVKEANAAGVLQSLCESLMRN